MTNIRFIGDVHGDMNFLEYEKIISDCSNSIQVGDFGIGFASSRHPVPTNAMMDGNHWFIRGNHDNPNECRKHPRWILDGSMHWIEHVPIFCVGGALSIDRHLRKEGINWWSDEELSMSSLNTVIDTYERLKPDIVVTHDCPDAIANVFFLGGKFNDPSRTRQAFDTMFEIHKPKFWLFGHWHESKRKTILGTDFICLAELEYLDLEFV